MPRIIPAKEWECSNADWSSASRRSTCSCTTFTISSRILKDGVIPAHYVLSGKHFRREFVNFEVPRDIYIHVCGTDLIRNEKGEYLVLEDNGRCPSGVSYVLENRRAMKRAFPGCSRASACNRWIITRRNC